MRDVWSCNGPMAYGCMLLFVVLACSVSNSWKDLKKMSEALQKDLINEDMQCEEYDGEPFIMGKQLRVRWMACNQLPEFHADSACNLVFGQRHVIRLHYLGNDTVISYFYCTAPEHFPIVM